MSFSNRKPTRLPHYDYSTPGAYFITICTQDRKNLLGRIIGGDVLEAPSVRLSSFGEVVEACIASSKQVHGIHIDKYVIMPNHIHMILQIVSADERPATPANERLPRYISGLKRLVHKQTGAKLFQRSYHDHVIRDEKDYQRIWQYIDSNPALWEKDCLYSKESLWGVEDAAPYEWK